MSQMRKMASSKSLRYCGDNLYTYAQLKIQTTVYILNNILHIDVSNSKKKMMKYEKVETAVV
jgi:hypothetical protein